MASSPLVIPSRWSVRSKPVRAKAQHLAAMDQPALHWGQGDTM